MVEAEIRELLAQATGFEWDGGNAAKVAARHDVGPAECEQAFFAEPLLVSFDKAHSMTEPRWQALGRTSEDRLLFLVFTLRNTLIRVLAARDMNRKEKLRYGEVKKRIAKDSNV